MNRLKLDWALSTSVERTNFIKQYIQQDSFVSRPLNSEELETISNYILWGKDEKGNSLEKDGYVELPRKNSTWSAQNVDSLDELAESPTFNEASLYSLNSKLPTKKVREVFSRTKALKNAPEHLIETYKTLWKEIDKTELTINFYELKHGKRTKDPRQELLDSLEEKEITECRDRAEDINQFSYLKLRHLLVELRREQYTLKDSFSDKILLHNSDGCQEDTLIKFENDLNVFPLGVCDVQSTQKLIFRPFNELIPENFSEDELKEISKFLWNRPKKNMIARSIHFTDLETVYQLFMFLEEFEDEAEENKENPFSLTPNLLNTLKFYIKETVLTEPQKEILDLKIKKEKNQDIAIYINKKYGKSYTANYISTIFRQKIIPAINETAAYHEKIIENLFFKEEFKVCIKCGRRLLRDPINFVRKSRAKDGLSNRCKCCDKQDRDEKKNKEENKNG